MKKKVENRLQKIEKSTPKINSMSNLTDKELKVEMDRIVARLKILLDVGNWTIDEIAETNRLLSRAYDSG
jgi:hypothetical protein